MEKRLLFGFLLGLFAFAQSPLGTVTGVAFDPSESPVANARVSLLNQGTGLGIETRTNQAGVYAFPNLPAGDYRLPR